MNILRAVFGRVWLNILEFDPACCLAPVEVRRRCAACRFGALSPSCCRPPPLLFPPPSSSYLSQSITRLAESVGFFCTLHHAF